MIPFNKPYLTGDELINIQAAHQIGQLAGDGNFTKDCQSWLQSYFNAELALITHSCTAALEMSALLGDIKAGDEVILPSYTFVSTANAFALRGATPVFVDINPETLNVDEDKMINAITSKTKALVPVNYGGSCCDLDRLVEAKIASSLLLIEDAAQSILSTYRGKPLGSIGDLSTISFHETKNIISGEGGALIINNPNFSARAEIIREKGTDRSLFFRGITDKYTWRDIGSSFLPGELIAAFLNAQLVKSYEITDRRKRLWMRYHTAFADIESIGIVRRPRIPEYCNHNGHIYYLLLNSEASRDQFISRMMEKGIRCVFHYIPLHSAPFGIKVGRVASEMNATNQVSSTIVRLPLWVGLEEYQEYVIDEAINTLKTLL